MAVWEEGEDGSEGSFLKWTSPVTLTPQILKDNFIFAKRTKSSAAGGERKSAATRKASYLLGVATL